MSALARMVMLVTPYGYSEPHRFWGNLHAWNLIFFSRFLSHIALILDTFCYVKCYIDVFLSILMTYMSNTSISNVKLVENRRWLTRENNNFGRTITPFYSNLFCVARAQKMAAAVVEFMAKWQPIFLNQCLDALNCAIIRIQHHLRQGARLSSPIPSIWKKGKERRGRWLKERVATVRATILTEEKI